MTRFERWLLATRPKTLTLSLAPVLTGTAMAGHELGRVYWPPALGALLAALLIQIGTNLYNDAVDFERGTDTAQRLGPERATAQGWFTPAQVKQAAALSFGLAFLVGIYLSWHGGWPIVVIGLASLLAGYAYTGGPHPISYSATGELLVFIFFGLVAVLASHQLQGAPWSLDVLLAACAIGCLASAVLLVNNYRDLDTDRQADKLTLAHYLGRVGSRLLYAVFLLLPFLLPPLSEGSAGRWLVLAALPLALLLMHRFFTLPPGPALNRILARTAQLQLLYALLLAAGLNLFP